MRTAWLTMLLLNGAMCFGAAAGLAFTDEIVWAPVAALNGLCAVNDLREWSRASA